MKLRKLIKLYQRDPLSRWHKLRHSTRRNHSNLLRQIDRRYGHVKLSKIKGATLLSWHAEWLDGTKFSSAHAFVKKLRAVFGFGLTILEDKHCARIRQVMSSMRFPGAPRRKQRITASQAAAIRAGAWRRDRGSVALAQAFQFDIMLRQKDTIGEYIPRTLAEGGPGIAIGDEKWVRGLLWSEIDDQLILRHQTSKTNKPVVVDLKLAPMIIEDLRRMGVVPSRGRIRLIERREGPVIVNELTRLPYPAYEFRRIWRAIARAEGIPDSVFNMDSRAGGITEAFDAGADPDFIRAAATHSELQTTQGYNRGDELSRSSAVLRARASTRRGTVRVTSHHELPQSTNRLRKVA
ncbi:hypothetical protein CWO91_16630 [Bradyrhizobium genosp. SA-3]|uniref:hypothetical protein n=1 Tax=Bradyrhizobium genosp. SA-3 TaxID=508868 RepID=UPI001029583F|nr:hypothetical protein [Bradyrhizobium genosp. SA-3]RZN09653.1 hypothetical protein CWO91_16630 [Bradyrhizobium genosp. SA-3]